MLHISRIWTNSARWQYFAALIVVFSSSLLDNAADFKETYDEISNGTMTTSGWQKARTISRITCYALNFFLVLFTLCWVLRTYNSFAKENEKIRQLFTGNINDVEAGIAAIKIYSENVLAKKRNWKENQTLKNTNIFASIYVSCCLAWSFAYAYEVVTMQQTITLGTILNCVAHFLSYGSLVTIMWLTNKIIDEMKKTALQKMSLEHRNTTVDLVSFKVFIQHYDPYASLFTKRINLPGIATTVLPGFVSLILPFIKSRFHW
ncbi:unnamed protein product [Rotaria sp. Silwood2]|nr:unnamed protein product [Rotaria sp. Silwood2]CAF2996039.1 unnamed protein product [Rotaria sp. Silwood2]CAF4131307.1 unnamed protein product [Rotaria sp. Silwood2]CAF4239541.1 unnamed protein product [Rotaria sp. Silwood2]